MPILPAELNLAEMMPVLPGCTGSLVDVGHGAAAAYAHVGNHERLGAGVLKLENVVHDVTLLNGAEIVFHLR